MKFTVVKSLEKQKPLALYPDVSELEMHAIGKMTVSWALLEAQLIRTTLELAEHGCYDLPPDFLVNSSLRKTLNELKRLISITKKPVKVKGFFVSVLKRVNNLKMQRHILTHGILTWSIDNPQRIRVQTPKAKQPQHFDVDKIRILAQKIAELNFELMYPGGEKKFLTDKIRDGSSISRKYALFAKSWTSSGPKTKSQKS